MEKPELLDKSEMEIDVNNANDQGVGTEPTGTAPEAPSPEGTTSFTAQPGGVDEEPEPVAATVKKLQSQVGSLHRRLEKASKRAPAPKLPDPIDDKDAPKAEDFSTIEEFEDAKTQFIIKKQVTEGVRKALEVDPGSMDAEDREEFKRGLQANGPTKYKDFIEVVSDPKIPITQEVLDAVRLSTDDESSTVEPEDVLYYLAKNPDEATRLSRMNPIQLGRAMVGVEAKVAQAVKANPHASFKENHVTNAPAPTTSTEAEIIVEKNPDTMSQAEYEAWRAKGGGK